MKGILLGALAAVLVASVAAQFSLCPKTNEEDVFLISNPQDCGSYFACDNGIQYLMMCSEGLHFNAQKRVCDWPENAACEPLPVESNEDDISFSYDDTGIDTDDDTDDDTNDDTGDDRASENDGYEEAFDA